MRTHHHHRQHRHDYHETHLRRERKFQFDQNFAIFPIIHISLFTFTFVISFFGFLTQHSNRYWTILSIRFSILYHSLKQNRSILDAWLAIKLRLKPLTVLCKDSELRWDTSKVEVSVGKSREKRKTQKNTQKSFWICSLLRSMLFSCITEIVSKSIWIRLEIGNTSKLWQRSSVSLTIRHTSLVNSLCLSSSIRLKQSITETFPCTSCGAHEV